MKFVIYHSADFDGIFCREIARKFLGNEDVTYIGWNYGEPEPVVPLSDELYILDLSIPSLMDHPKLVWIDHHKTAIDKYASKIRGYRIDGVAACRLAWQWFTEAAHLKEVACSGNFPLPTLQDFFDRQVVEPLAVRLAGEYDVWDKRDVNVDLFQHALRSEELTPRLWFELLDLDIAGDLVVLQLLKQGKFVRYANQTADASLALFRSFEMIWEGLRFLCLNTARCNSLTFAAAVKPDHDALMGFYWNGKRWTVSLYGAPGKPEVDLAAIAVKFGGGGHKQACGFSCNCLPFEIED